MNNNFAIYALDNTKAYELSKKFNCKIIQEVNFSKFNFILNINNNAELLINPKLNIGKSLKIDFEKYKSKFKDLKNSNLNKAISIKGVNNPIILDATGGLAMDAFKLSMLGARVYIYEKNVLLFYLIKEAINNYYFKKDFFVFNKDSTKEFSNLEKTFKPDIIYLDPMFQTKKKMAKVKKEFQILQSLIGPPEQEEDLLKTALTVKPKRVVVKRMLKAEPIKSDREINFSYEGKTSRYDIYLAS